MFMTRLSNCLLQFKPVQVHVASHHTVVLMTADGSHLRHGQALHKEPRDGFVAKIVEAEALYISPSASSFKRLCDGVRL